MTDMPATADEPVRLLLVDDHPMMRKGVAQLLELEDDLSVVGEAGSGEEALRLAAELDPDMILLDLNMKGMNGLDTLRAGADGYLLKDMEPERLLEHIRQAATGQMTLSPQLTQILAQALRGDDRSKSLDELTERERQILRQIAHGYSNKMIARKLDITEGTVKVHVKRVLHKLGMRSRVEAAVWAVENDLV
ncbi:DNA-binding response regulator [Pseudomonas aeruginosa]|uniref:LuxR C-terminal-related transcriptional regulator n=1 Tax=Pseudomonas aeruginosa TaxID=287 RepID=UPI001A215C06|nr:LuxR C-terminal-related transcriptional regulator [Pseudomonas aeruginosa]MBH8893266.1 response regulator [Pseudomonas aeruginosa]GLF40432.1 DNA-binding response regulator [Pseudomonas aeruginosa]GLF73300.1 DNA-binding response regulator [Pseudomonas aeruginosa]HEJ2045269.1 response regulator [Pseudomonas aeruginosa]